MGRRKEAPFYLRSRDGWARLEYTTAEGGRRFVALAVPYDPKRSSPEERRAAEEAAAQKWRELTDGRVINADPIVKTELTLDELYALYLEQFAPPDNADPNTKHRMAATFGVRDVYGGHMGNWADNSARRPDKTPRWRDQRTPLQRLVEEPEDFLAWRLLSVKRKTMRKEKSNLVQFFAWAKSAGFLNTLPKVELPTGKGKAHGALAKSGRGVHIPMTTLQAAQVVASMPEWSDRTARSDGRRFLVRPFFELMRLTGLRPATIERLEVPRNWKPGMTTLRIDNEDDKALYGRELPLLPEAVELLEKYAPAKGHIFGHHDFRKHVKKAAKKVFSKEIAERFGAYHFRHFVATFLANRAGTNLVGAQYVLGHTDLGTTSGYVHADLAAARDLILETRKEIQLATKAAEEWAQKQGGRDEAGD